MKTIKKQLVALFSVSLLLFLILACENQQVDKVSQPYLTVDDVLKDYDFIQLMKLRELQSDLISNNYNNAGSNKIDLKYGLSKEDYKNSNELEMYLLYILKNKVGVDLLNKSNKYYLITELRKKSFNKNGRDINNCLGDCNSTYFTTLANSREKRDLAINLCEITYDSQYNACPIIPVQVVYLGQFLGSWTFYNKPAISCVNASIDKRDTCVEIANATYDADYNITYNNFLGCVARCN